MSNIGYPQPSVLEVLSWAEEDHVDFISIQFADVMGIHKHLTMPLTGLEEALTNGVWIDGSSIEGFVPIDASDMLLLPDRLTYAVVPWEERGRRTARLFGNVFMPGGDPFPGDARAMLQRQLDRLAGLGYGYHTGPELEFFLFGTDGDRITSLPHDRASYFDVSTDLAAAVRRAIVVALKELGIAVEQAHHEVATGQHEIDFRYVDALTTADNVMTFKYVVKAVAQRRGLHASFMPKPIAGVNGSGMHTHQSLYRLDDGGNAFVEATDAYGLSRVARQFMAGQLAHARGMAAVFAPTGNSYQRLVPGFEAPVSVSWGRANRSALIRVPAVRPRRRQATRIELRCPDPSCNPYLTFTVMLAAGIDGIERDLPLPQPIEETLYSLSEDDLKRRGVASLPATLGEAIAELEQDAVVRDALGEHVCDRLIEAQRQGWAAMRQHIGSWEHARYQAVY